MAQLTVSDQITKLERHLRELESEHNREPHSVKLLAVSKTRQVSEVKAAIAAGQAAFGENYAQELSDKSLEIGPVGVDWHFIGALQSNKAKLIAQHANWIHTIDRLKIAKRLQHHLSGSDKILQVCIQLNLDAEETKAGISRDELPLLAEQISELENLELRGLMSIPKPASDIASQRRHFAKVRQALDHLNQNGFALDTLSMGMSGDYQAAVAEGATMVRVGTAIFGKRR